MGKIDENFMAINASSNELLKDKVKKIIFLFK